MADRIEIPGDPGGLESLAGQLRNAADDVASVQGRLSGNSTSSPWRGKASDAFRSTLNELPGELQKVVVAFQDAAGAVNSFAARLAELQQAAAWSNQQIERSEEELRIAQARAQDEQDNLRAASHAHATATDPIGLASAKRAMDVSASLLRRAASDIEDLGARISSLAGSAAEIRSEYEDAIRACRAVLDAARHTAGRSFLGWVNDSIHGLTEGVEHLGGALWQDAAGAAKELEQGLDEAEHWALHQLDEHWDFIRAVLEETTTILGDVTLVASVVLPIVAVAAAATGVGAPVTLFALGLDEQLNAVNTGLGEGESVVVLAGDRLEASRGNHAAKEHLAGDVVKTATSWIPGDKLLGKAEAKLTAVPAVRSAVNKIMSLGEHKLPGAIPFLVHKEVDAGNQGAWKAASDHASDAADKAPPSVKGILTLPLERPVVLGIPIGLPL